jgi:hypothetical protein
LECRAAGRGEEGKIRKEEEREEETLEESSGHKGACEVKPLVFLCNFCYTCGNESYKL